MIRKIIPALDGKLQARALRVPVAKVSLVDISFEADKPLTVSGFNAVFKKAAQSTLKGILAFTMDPLVSTDFSGNPHSVIVDGTMTNAIGTMGHVFGWYDNEWGYSERLKDFLLSVR